MSQTPSSSKSRKKSATTTKEELLPYIEAPLSYGDRRWHGPNSWSMNVFMNRLYRVDFWTPSLRVLFGLNTYRHDDPQKRAEQGDFTEDPKYSMTLSLTRDTRKHEELIDLLYALDARCRLIVPAPQRNKLRYTSPIRDSKKFPQSPPCLRVKLYPCTFLHDATRFNVQMADDTTEKSQVFKFPSIESFQDIVTHNSRVCCRLQLLPFWCLEKVYGMSFRVLEIRVLEHAVPTENLSTPASMPCLSDFPVPSELQTTTTENDQEQEDPDTDMLNCSITYP